MPNEREGSIYQDSRGLWTATIELPSLDGKRRRKRIRSKDESVVRREYRRLLERRDTLGDFPTKSPTLGEWMDEWYRTVAVNRVRPKTAQTYELMIRLHINPTIGKKKLEKLTPRDVRFLHQALRDKGLSSTSALQAHRILSVALKHAEREGLIARNVATLVDAPRKARPDIRALTLDEGIQVLRTAVDDPYGSLWASVLLTGARQGELLGLEIDRVSDVLDVSWQMQRLTWQHGCAKPCNRKLAAHCPAKKLNSPDDWESRHITGGFWFSRPKSNAGWRIIPLVEPLSSIIHGHIEEHADEPNPFNLVWRRPNGMPIEPRTQSDMWHDLLDRAGVPQVRLHDGRHTTVDLLYEAGVPEDLIIEIVGHSSRIMTRGYKSRTNRTRLTKAMENLSSLLEARGDAHSGTPGPASLTR